MTTTSTPSELHYLTTDETRALLAVAAIKSIRDHAIWTTAYWHGMRASEVGLLTLDHVRLDASRIFITRLKGSNSGEYPMSPEEVSAMRAWLKVRGSDPGPLFASQRGAGISRQRLHNLMKGYCDRAGIRSPKDHFHVLRHSIAVHMADRGMDVAVIQDWLGHKSITSTMVYMKITNKSRVRTAEAMFAPEKISPISPATSDPRPRINWAGNTPAATRKRKVSG